MQNYDDLIKRNEDLWIRLKGDSASKAVTKKEIQKLVQDMVEFVEEDHPANEIAMFYPLGCIENLGFLLDDSNPDKSHKFSDDVDGVR